MFAAAAAVLAATVLAAAAATVLAAAPPATTSPWPLLGNGHFLFQGLGVSLRREYKAH